MILGFVTFYVEEDGEPAERKTDHMASGFVVLGWLICIWNMRPVEVLK